MQISQADRLNSESLGAFRRIYSALEAPAAVRGLYRSEFVGPSWLRLVAPRGLVILGLGGWCGKEFGPDGSGVNLLRRGGAVRRGFPVEVAPAPSRVDGRPCLAVTYPPVNPWPWPSVVDELRQLEPGTLLGLTFFRIGPAAHLPLPFLLHQDGVS
ncbi:MAG: hypothetical protein SFU83_14875 [Meiothermus sp.]|nr:hypothetical protein [Meiothermus sp.]